ncbi:MAG: AAA family ATPase, partial [Pyrobaculum sp.]
MSEWIELKVLESKARDANRPIVRIDPEVMERAGIVVGDVVEIVGRRRTAAKVWSGLPEDRGKGIVRMNSILRKNADVSLNEAVKIRKVEPRHAVFVKLAPVSMTIAVDPNFLQYIKQRLREYVVVEGDMLQIYVLSQPLTFQV